MGIATTNAHQRIAASLGAMQYVETQFDASQGVMSAGVLLALPALLSQGLDIAFDTYDDLPRGYYGLHHIVLLSCFMALCRIKNTESLKSYPPGELGKILGLDRVPEVGHLRKKYKQIFIQKKTDAFHSKLFTSWLDNLPELFFYIDGHVRVYHGSKANLAKRYVSREKLCLNGTSEFWVNDQAGLPLMVITGELNEKLKEAVNDIVEKLKQEVPEPSNNQTPRFTIVIDRESYEPRWYRKLWDDHQISVITYRKNVKDKWEEDQFVEAEYQLFNNTVTMQICERGVNLSNYWFREIRRLSKSGHQTSIITTNWQINSLEVALKMFSRWTQENYFKYMIENFDFDKMIEYGTESIDPKRSIVNPEYRKISYQLKKTREKKRRKEAKVYQKIESQSDKTIEQVQQDIAKTSDLIEQINADKKLVNQLLLKRGEIPARISIADMAPDLRFEKLKQEGKKFKNAIVMLAYRAETALFNSLPKYFLNARKEGRALLREIFSSDADLMPNSQNKTLTITIHSLSTPRFNQALQHLCEIMNETKTVYPNTNLKMIFKSMAV